MKLPLSSSSVMSTILISAIITISTAEPINLDQRSINVAATEHQLAERGLLDLWYSYFANMFATPATTPTVAATPAKVTTTSKTSSTSSKTTSTTSSRSSSTSKTSSSTSRASTMQAIASETVGKPNVIATSVAAPPQATTTVVVNGVTVNTNTSTVVAPVKNSTNTTTAPVIVPQANGVSSTILVIARDAASAYSAFSGLNGYGIPYQVLIVPQSGIKLPVLNATTTWGNFGAIVVLSEVSYNYGAAGYQSALNATQWNSLYNYQISFGVRMVRLDVFPSESSGTTVVSGGCCAAGQEQFISISNSLAFPYAGLVNNAKMSTLGLYHYPATITNPNTTTEFAQFGTTAGYSGVSTAGVINNFSGREQMVFFTSFANDWSETSNFLQHAWIQWATRGLFAGYRRVYLGTQVDDMFLESSIYYPVGANNTFRIRTSDLDAVKTWIGTVNKKLPAGSSYFMEVGHNGNGNIDQADALDKTGLLCVGKNQDGPIEYDGLNDTALEFQKPLGTGINYWPSLANPHLYPFPVACTRKDPLLNWWATPANRDVFAHVSHTFSHESENNATYFDIANEISWNQAWMGQTGISAASKFSSYGLIPPAITGLHNGDALKAWSDFNITRAVGDNTRPALLNTKNEHWPLMTTVAANGFDGIQITPRWATNIYYNCDSAQCTVQEWHDTSAGASGDIYTLLDLEKQTSARHLLGLRHDPYMFHQANLRQTDVASITINGVTQQLSLIQMWVETVVQEMVRIVTWPIVSLKHDDISAAFADRFARDQCGYNANYIMDPKAKTITGITVTANNNQCSSAVPVTIPGKVVSSQGFKTEQLGSDPLTIWVTSFPATFTLTTPIAW